MNKMTTLSNAMEQMASAVTTTNQTVASLAGQISVVQNRLDAFNTRITNLEDNAEITTEQRRAIKKAVTRKVYEILELPLRRQDWTQKNKMDSQIYSPLFFKRCYTEVSNLGHLASPYGLTTKANYADAIKDIGEWTPLGGVKALKNEAEDNARTKYEGIKEILHLKKPHETD